MGTKKMLALAIIAIMSAFSVTASATIITFDPLELPGTGFTDLYSYSENGFILKNLFQGGLLESAQQGNTGFYFGSAGLFNNISGGTTILSKDNGGTFSFNSIDLAPYSTTYGAGANVSFIGDVNGGSTVSASFTLNNSFAFQTFSLNGFNNLRSVRWLQVAPFHQFDNINVTAAIPEPETYAMLLAGLGLLGFTAWRRKNLAA